MLPIASWPKSLRPRPAARRTVGVLEAAEAVGFANADLTLEAALFAALAFEHASRVARGGREDQNENDSVTSDGLHRTLGCNGCTSVESNERCRQYNLR